MERDRRTAILNRLQNAALAVAVVAALVGFGSMLLGLRGGEAAADGAPPEHGGGARVEVLNAAGVPGLAREGTRRLRDAGFDVVYFGNAGGEARGESLVLDRTGNLQTAQAVARALNIPRVRSEPDPQLYLDVSVVLGRDWRRN